MHSERSLPRGPGAFAMHFVFWLGIPAPALAQDARSSTVSDRSAWTERETKTATSAAVDSFPGSPLTSPERADPEVPLDVPMLVLALPGTLTELAFVPLIPLVLAFEKLDLHERIFDFLTNDSKTIALVPILELVNRSGFTAGASFIRNDPLGSPDRLVAYALMRTNLDRAASLSYTRRLAFLSGKTIHFGASYDLDHDARYYGIGGDTQVEDERLVEIRDAGVSSWIEVPAPSEWNARLALEYRRRRLSTGEGPSPGLAPDDPIAPPAGFGRTLDYPEAKLTLQYDSRDSASRTTTGFVTTLEGSATHDLNGGNTGGVLGTAKLATFLPLLPLNRVLVVAVGAGLSSTLGDGDEIPYHSLVSLGGSTRLRGYVSDRFVDRLGWWGSLEYRYKVFEYGDTGNGLSATLFGDAGRVGRHLEDLIDGPIRYSVGFGFRAEADLFFLARFQVAYSPDGIRVVIAVNEIL